MAKNPKTTGEHIEDDMDESDLDVPTFLRKAKF